MLQIVQPFWREELLTGNETELINALFLAHHQSCYRDNISSDTLINAMVGSGDFSKAIAAAILTTGAVHAPIEDTYWFLLQAHPEKDVKKRLEADKKIPGWGGTFQKNEPDPIWHDVDQLIRRRHPDIGKILTDVTEALAENEKRIFPNPSAYTACVALALDVPPKVVTYLFIAARLSAWGHLVLKYSE
jgi:citrate synthase